MAKQDKHQRAKERYSDAQEAMREQHARMLEDMRFSNPSDPQQWPDDAKSARKNRPCLTFDRTNQFLQQVVNDARQNKPAIKCLPADSGADIGVASKLDGIIRHIEYVSRAGIAYDMAIDHAARVGLGWLRVVPEVIRPETNEQEIRIMRIHDPLSVLLDADSSQPDGSDASYGFVETLMSAKAFEAAYPKATAVSMDGGTWSGIDGVKLCEYFEVVKKQENRIVVLLEGQQMLMTEDEYWQACAQVGFTIPTESTTMVETRKVIWQKMTGAEILEETDFPSQYIPLVPVVGDEIWIEGKRYLCGMVRKLMDSQRFHNYTISQLAETIALQPKAPFIAPKEAIEGNEQAWRNANNGTASYLPYNHVDSEGNPIPRPERQQPPTMSQGWAEMLQYSNNAMESSIGMFKANLGQQGNETSGRAIRARQMEGDTANFHYVDNMSRSIEQLGRIIVDMIPRVIKIRTQSRILGEDGKQDFVQIDPTMKQAVRKDQNGKVVAINPGVGNYDVRVNAGPSYTSVREEAAQNIVDITQGNPQLGAALAPMLMKMRDMPEGDKAYKVALALLPPNVQSAYEDEEGEQLSPEHQAKMQQMQQQLEQAMAALENAGNEVDKLEAERDNKAQELELKAREVAVKEFEAQTKRFECEKQEPEQFQLPQGEDPELVKLQIARENNESAERMEKMRLLAKSQADEMAAFTAAQHEPHQEQTGDAALSATLEAIQQMVSTMQAPKRVVYDDTGRVAGVETIQGEY